MPRLKGNEKALRENTALWL